jgi:gamma-glutamyltranspeptidase/glutathione hydrolase
MVAALMAAASPLAGTAASAQTGSAQTGSAQTEPVTPVRPVVGRSVVATPYGIVATSQPLASMAGVQILERGGNAIDAAIAANATIGLMEPMMNGMGGDLFAVVYEAKTGKLYGLNSSGWAPTGLTPELVNARGAAHPDETGAPHMPNRGIYTVTVPGAVAGWDALRQRFGHLPFSTILAPAIHYAESGFPVSEVDARWWGEGHALLSADPGASATYLREGRAPGAGTMFRNPDLAASLRAVAAHGRDGFYLGRTAEALVAFSRAEGGTLTPADLADFRPEWVTPVQTTYRGWTVSELPPNTQGVGALMMLNIMERFPLAEYGFHSARALHVMIEAKKLAYADVLRYVGDPRFSQIPVQEMLSKDRAAARAALIDPQHARCDVRPSDLAGVAPPAGSETIYLSVVDRAGNIVSLIQSNFSAFGSGLVAPGTGFALQNRGALFSLVPGQPNTLAPHKRPLHTLIPGFMQKGDTRIGFGIMGGWNQAQAHAQFVAGIADFGFNIQEALEAGRFTKLTFAGCDVEIESLVSDSTRRSLAALGHQLTVLPPRTGEFGYGQAVMSDSAGVHFGGSDPRHDGAAIPEGPEDAFPLSAPVTPHRTGS